MGGVGRSTDPPGEGLGKGTGVDPVQGRRTRRYLEGIRVPKHETVCRKAGARDRVAGEGGGPGKTVPNKWE